MPCKQGLPLPPEIENPEQYPYLYDEQIEVNESVPDENEIQDVLKTFKNNKSSGTDNIKTECLKYNKTKTIGDRFGVRKETLMFTFRFYSETILKKCRSLFGVCVPFRISFISEPWSVFLLFT